MHFSRQSSPGDQMWGARSGFPLGYFQWKKESKNLGAPSFLFIRTNLSSWQIFSCACMSHFIYDVAVMMQLADRMVAPTTDYIKRPPSLQREKRNSFEILRRLKNSLKEQFCLTQSFCLDYIFALSATSIYHINCQGTSHNLPSNCKICRLTWELP